MVIIKKGKNTKTTVYINLDINKVDKRQFKSLKKYTIYLSGLPIFRTRNIF